VSAGLLIRYLEAGFPHLRQVARLPAWLVPKVGEHGACPSTGSIIVYSYLAEGG
jgi:hypothetical protein